MAAEQIAQRAELVGRDDGRGGRQDIVAVVDAERDGHLDLLR
ncbi:hypothetical protein FHY02_004323 [Sphingomonas sp. BK069]|nr:hypothetical protein [Sphingomonas sp. BK069]